MLERRGNTNCIRLDHDRMTSANVLIAPDRGLAACSYIWQRTRIDEWDDTRSAPNAAARYIRLGLTHLTLPTECLNPSRAPLARPPQPRPRINHKWLARAFQPQAGMS